MDLDPDWSESLDIMKQENPWDVVSIFDLAYFCCPECDFKHQGKQDFVSHASNNHPWVSLSLFLPFNLKTSETRF
jgi:hypothetical protein